MCHISSSANVAKMTFGTYNNGCVTALLECLSIKHIQKKNTDRFTRTG